MLHKRIDLGSQPFGLAVAGEDLIKGRAVIVVPDATAPNGLKAMLPTTEAEAESVKGFATFRIEEEGGADTDFETIKQGTWVVIYTLVKDNVWATTEFEGTPSVGDKFIVDFTAGKEGKLIDVGATSRTPQFEVFGKQDAGAGFTSAMVEVSVL